MRTITLVDDDCHVLSSLGTALETVGYKIRTYSDGAAALDSLNRYRPDAAIVGINLPKLDGFELLRHLRQTSSMPVICLASKGDENDEFIGLRLGADDFVRKPFSVRVLVERIEALLRRKRVDEVLVSGGFDTFILRRGKLCMDPQRYSCTWSGHEINLTAREFTLVWSLAQEPELVKPRNTLMAETHANGVFVSVRTIDSHIKRIREKFRAVDKHFRAIESVYRLGYRFVIT